MYSEISFDDIKNKVEKKFNKVQDLKDYEYCLLIYNQKGLARSVGHFYNINDKEYCNFILRKIKNEKYEELVKLFIKYLPSKIHIC